MEENTVVKEKETAEPKKKGGFVRFLKAVFVHNAGYKVFALLFGAAIWLLVVGLGVGQP